MRKCYDSRQLKVTRKLKDKPKNQHLGSLGISSKLNLGVSTYGIRNQHPTIGKYPI